ncbi:MAG: biphenyl 2,3-dioxygenase [Cyanobacteria bacterium J083]|nr:MAG: biphenyl 2,3-dioxygenase [Cyanobacteria bacterium J083]
MQIKISKTLQQSLTICLTVLFCWALFITSAWAAEKAIEVKVSLGNAAGELKFFPNNLEFKVGQPYKLVLNNPSPVKHYFTAKDFADASWTKNVKSSKVEVKGAIHEIELKPTGEATWQFIPMQAGTYELHCSIPGHAAAGMKGEIKLIDG